MAKADFKFNFPFRVRYSEVDGQKVVFNAHYLTYFDTALTEYFRFIGFDYMAHVESSGNDLHTVKTVVEYKAPIEFDDEIEVYVNVSRLGRSSITFYLEIHLKAEDNPLATGEVVWVYTDQETHKSTALPEELVKLLS
ncbi:MAG: acyl-CoA thioesterase [Rhodospirillales bacterium]|nr:acyl-CoA thioesterase [Rhodospirillales bacterium]